MKASSRFWGLKNAACEPDTGDHLGFCFATARPRWDYRPERFWAHRKRRGRKRYDHDGGAQIDQLAQVAFAFLVCVRVRIIQTQVPNPTNNSL